MCGRYTLVDPAATLADRFAFDLGELEETLPPRYNIAPSQPILTVTDHHAQLLRWGLQTEDPKRSPINLRSEPYARRLPRLRRCLIPADGFFEWQTMPGRGGKQPMYIRLRDGALFALAGIYTEMREDTPGTCAIITCAPNDLMVPIHDRMPAVLDPADEQTWLDPRVTASGDVLGMLRPYPGERMQAYAVDTLVNNVRYDMPDLVAPVG